MGLAVKKSSRFVVFEKSVVMMRHTNPKRDTVEEESKAVRWNALNRGLQ